MKNHNKAGEKHKKIADAKTHIHNAKKTVVILALICILVIILIIFFAIRTYNHFTELRSHRDYFRQPNASIQDWMTVRSIVKHYNLSESMIYSEMNVSPGTLLIELGIDNSTTVDRLTIKRICDQKHLDCNMIIERLNSIRTK